MFHRIASIILPLLIAVSISSAKDDSIVLLSPNAKGLTKLNKVPLLHIEIPEAAAPDSGLSVLLTTPFSWHRSEEDDSPYVLTAKVDPNRFSHAILTVWSWNNEPICQQYMAAGDSSQLSLQIEGLGSYLLTLDGFSSGIVQKRLIRNIARTPDLNSARTTWTKDFFLGICTFPGRYHWTVDSQPVCPPGLTEQQARDLEASYMARLGFQVVRVDECMEMGRSEPGSADPYIWDFNRMDAAVESYTSRGFELDLQLMNAPDWAVLPKYKGAPGSRWRYPHVEEHQRTYVRTLLNRYGNHARMVQIFNEPDQIEFWAGEPGEFVHQFRFTHDEIRDYSQSLPIANGGYAFVDENRIRYFARELRPLIDYPAYHSHGSLTTMRKTFDAMKAVHLEVGYVDPQFLNTETGFDAWRLDQERRQAQADVQKALFCWASGHSGVLLFCGRMVKGPGREDRDLGLLDYHFCPRFSYTAVSGLVSALSGATFERTHLQSEKSYIYEFRRKGDIIVAAFSLEEEGETFTFQSDAEEAVLMDAMGNRSEPQTGTSLTLKLGAYPTYLILEGAHSVGVIE